jgi:hypothetical protein
MKFRTFPKIVLLPIALIQFGVAHSAPLPDAADSPLSIKKDTQNMETYRRAALIPGAAMSCQSQPAGSGCSYVSSVNGKKVIGTCWLPETQQRLTPVCR